MWGEFAEGSGAAEVLGMKGLKKKRKGDFMVSRYVKDTENSD